MGRSAALPVGVGPVNNPPTLANGDVLCAIRSGAILTFTRTPNGSTTPVTLVTTNNSPANTYTGGAPGIGMFNEGGVLSDDTLYGFSSFQARTTEIINPAPPTNLRVTKCSRSPIRFRSTRRQNCPAVPRSCPCNSGQFFRPVAAYGPGRLRAPKLAHRPAR